MFFLSWDNFHQIRVRVWWPASCCVPLLFLRFGEGSCVWGCSACCVGGKLGYLFSNDESRRRWQQGMACSHSWSFFSPSTLLSLLLSFATALYGSIGSASLWAGADGDRANIAWGEGLWHFLQAPEGAYRVHPWSDLGWYCISRRCAAVIPGVGKSRKTGRQIFFCILFVLTQKIHLSSFLSYLHGRRRIPSPLSYVSRVFSLSPSLDACHILS